ncbi:MAG: PspA-associated protein PspAB [Acidimicrobiales bacterium]
MGLLNTIMGRTKPVQANLDSLFGLPSASITLQSAAGMTLSGRAGVCYKPPTGQGFADMQAEVMKLLDMEGDCKLRTAEDTYGYHWVVVENPDIESLVTEIHLINSSLSDSGWGPQLLCSVFGVATLPDGSGASEAGAAPGPTAVLDSTGFLVYLFKRGTFYPFVPDGKEHRNIEQELKLKSLVANDLALESDLDRWFPLWDLPVG